MTNLTISGVVSGSVGNFGNIQLDTNGQIIAKGTASTLFGTNETNGNTLLCGHDSFALTMRGSSSRPSYNGTNVALQSDIPTNYVTTNTNQDISGAKTFSNAVTINSNLNINGKISNTDKICSYSGYEATNHGLSSGKYFSNYNVLIFVFEETGGHEYVTMTIPRAVFTADPNRKFEIMCNTANTNRWMDFYYVNDNTFRISGGSYVEMREIWGIR